MTQGTKRAKWTILALGLALAACEPPKDSQLPPSPPAAPNATKVDQCQDLIHAINDSRTLLVDSINKVHGAQVDAVDVLSESVEAGAKKIHMVPLSDPSLKAKREKYEAILFDAAGKFKNVANAMRAQSGQRATDSQAALDGMPEQESAAVKAIADECTAAAKAQGAAPPPSSAPSAAPAAAPSSAPKAP